MLKYRIGIVGGSGFIGISLAKHLSKTFQVKVLDKNPIPDVLKNRVEFGYCDIQKYDEVELGLNNINLVIHVAIIQIPLINEIKRLGYEVNIIGTHNVCKVVDESPSIKGMILSGSWHVFGEKELKGVIDEEFGFRPDKVEDRARLYALSKITQECIVRFHDEMSDKIYGIIRMGTVLGEGMPERTAANIFITKGLNGEALTPYKHSMYRPMLYVDIGDVCKAYEVYARKILGNKVCEEGNSLAHIINLYWPEPVTILELATKVREAVIKYSQGKIKPKIRVVDTGKPSLFTYKDRELLKVDVNKSTNFLGLKKLTNIERSIEKIVKGRIKAKSRALRQDARGGIQGLN